MNTFTHSVDHSLYKKHRDSFHNCVTEPEESIGSISEASEHVLSCRTPSFIAIGHQILDVKERDLTTSAIKSSSMLSTLVVVLLPSPRSLLACTLRTSDARESHSVVSVRNEKVGPRAGFSFVAVKTDGEEWGGWTDAGLFSTSTIKP